MVAVVAGAVVVVVAEAAGAALAFVVGLDVVVGEAAAEAVSPPNNNGRPLGAEPKTITFELLDSANCNVASMPRNFR